MLFLQQCVMCVRKSKLCFHSLESAINVWVLLSCMITTGEFIQRKRCFYFILLYGVETTEKWLLTTKPTPFPLLHSAKKGQSFEISLQQLFLLWLQVCHVSFVCLLPFFHPSKLSYSVRTYIYYTSWLLENNSQGKDYFKVKELPRWSLFCMRVCPGLVE